MSTWLGCPNCHSVTWHKSYKSGFDIPCTLAVCKKDGCLAELDGHDIPWQSLWGYGGVPAHLDIRINPVLREALFHIFEEHWLTRFDPSNLPSVPYPDHPSLFRFSNITFNLQPDMTVISRDYWEKRMDDCVHSALDNWTIIAEDFPEFLDVTDGNVRPATFSDLSYLYGLLHSTDVWDEDCIFMIDSLGDHLSEMIAFSDDVYQYLVDHDFVEKDALKAAMKVRMGKALQFRSLEMDTARDKWVLSRLEKIKYLFPKAHAVEYIIFMLKRVYSD